MSSESTQMLQINGAPGIGKTSLIKRVVMETKYGTDNTQLNDHYINIDGLSDINTIRSKLMLTLGQSEGAMVCQQFASFDDLENFHLIIFDHLEVVHMNRELQTSFQQLCEEMIEATDNVFLVLVSRFQFKFASYCGIFTTLKLLPLSLDESHQLLQSLLPLVDIEQEILMDLIDLCEGIPLALILAAKILQNQDLSPDDLCSILRENQMDAFHCQTSDNEYDITSAIKTSVDQLTNLLKSHYVTLAYFPGDFGVDAAVHVLGMENTATTKQDALLPLAKRSLVSIETKTQRVNMHSILRHFMEERYSSLRDEEHTRMRYCEFYALLTQRLAPLVDANNCKKLPLFIQEIHHIEKLLKEAVHCAQEHYNLFIQLAYHAEYLLTNFFGKESVMFYEACVNSAAAYAEAHHDPKTHGLMLSSYGQVLGFIGSDYIAAYKAYMKSLAILEPLGETEDLAWLYSHIGFNFHNRGMEKEAIRWLYKALHVFRNILGKLEEEEKSYENKDAAVPESLKKQFLRTQRLMCGTLASLGIVHCCTGNFNESQKYSQESLERRQSMWGLHPVVGSTHNNISYIYQGQGDDDGFFEYAMKGLRIKMRFDQRPSNANISSLCNVAMQCCCRGNTVDALKFTKKAYHMVKQIGLDHNNASLIYTCFGEIYSNLEDYDEALKWHEKAVEHRKERLGLKHQFTAEALHCHGNTLLKAGKCEKALEKLSECLEIRKSFAGDVESKNIGIAKVEEHIGQVYSKLGQTQKAKHHYSHAVNELVRLHNLYTEKNERKNMMQTQQDLDVVKDLKMCVDTGAEPTLVSTNITPLNIYSLSW
ncbi:uncharacterized protein LOC144441271 [Glandiceps talaboti]